ncbi:Acyl-CoA dehydrogenase family member 11 [Colletotrichum shisoi]|uniref:Acyl-CoA dehydrogenase family member 11 n=1 Tax=Colletotrichum shisoi TaxID=2078593 RepID=A0A5Q4BJE7_9PEZI|nr:Acyl-CoA dehydrogenase family member 11 [Colletotrichum shisoi]
MVQFKVLQQTVTAVFLPSVEVELAQLGEGVLSDRVFSWVTDPERNKPYLKGNGRDAFGRPTSELVVGEGWRGLQDFGIRKGIVATGYDASLGSSARMVQFLRLHLWEGSASNVSCPSAMQDGAARLLQLHLAKDADPTQRKGSGNALDQRAVWMAERTGGSDVSLTETVASHTPSAEQGLADAQEGILLGPWSISGLKWFSSATDAAMTILLARTENGISAFFAPVRRHSSSAATMRLKNKSGTRSLPTAELELDGMRGWLLGQEGRGVHEISTVLTLARVHSAVAAVGYVGRGLAIARAYAKVRQVHAGRGRRMPLSESPLHMQTLADMTGLGSEAARRTKL